MTERITILNNLQKPQIQTVKVVGATSVGVAGVHRLTQLEDVNASEVDNNDTLVYDQITGMYVIKVLPLVDDGEF